MITKIAQPPYWPKVLSGLRKITNLPPKVREFVASPQKLTWHSAPTPDVDSNATAYVTTGDSDDDGNIDQINMVISNLNKAVDTNLLNQLDESSEEFKEMIKRIAEILVHEVAHLEDYHHEHGFRGGEAIAESKERAFEPIFAQSTTNKKIGTGGVTGLTFEGELKMKQELVKLANHLDGLGHRDLADRLDEILKSSGVLGDAWEGAKEVGQKALRGQALNVGEGSYYEIESALKALWKTTTCKGTPGLNPCEPMSSLSGLGEELLGKAYATRSVPFDAQNDGPVQKALSKKWINDTFLKALETWGQNNAAESVESGPMASTPPDLADDNSADDYLSASKTAEDRINKLAELMAGEFNTHIPGTFSR